MVVSTHIYRSCASKRRYSDEGDALAGAVRLVGKGAPSLRAYECRFCEGWHLTKQVKTAGPAAATEQGVLP